MISRSVEAIIKESLYRWDKGQEAKPGLRITLTLLSYTGYLSGSIQSGSQSTRMIS